MYMISGGTSSVDVMWLPIPPSADLEMVGAILGRELDAFLTLGEADAP